MKRKLRERGVAGISSVNHTMIQQEQLTMPCRNPHKPSICLCPADGSVASVRHILKGRFINGWLRAKHVSEANALAADPSSSDDELWTMLAKLEDFATDDYEVWR